MKKTILVMVAVFVLVGVFGGCGTEKKPLAVTSIPPLKCMLTELLGDWVDVECVMPAGNSPFTFQPTEADLAIIKKADFVLINGGGVDSWMNEHIGDIPSFNLLESAIERGLTNFDEDNPFIYLDIYAIRELSLVLAPILEKEIEGSFGVKSNAYYMEVTLATLEDNWQNRFRKLHGRAFIGMTKVWNEIADVLGIDFAGYTYNTPTQMPDPSKKDEIAEIAKREDVNLVIVEPEFGAVIADEIANEYNMDKVSISTMGDGEGTYSEYIDSLLMEVYSALE
ncbi:MAG: zinc ABC transporter substrate-binding protein [Caldisericia bacterium]|nr:zinc ABC transporter substrate-binding protein [Caldisericia bacterium]